MREDERGAMDVMLPDADDLCLCVFPGCDCALNLPQIELLRHTVSQTLSTVIYLCWRAISVSLPNSKILKVLKTYIMSC